MKKHIGLVTAILAMALCLSCEYISDLNEEVALTDGLVAYWPMNDYVDPMNPSDSPIKDYAQNNVLELRYDGPPEGSTHTAESAAGRYGKALYFDGQYDYAECDKNNFLNSSNSTSFTFWIKDPVGSIYDCISTQAFSVTFERNPANTTGYIAFSIKDFGGGASGTAYVNNPSNINLNNWTFIAGTYDQKNISLYINGKLVNTTPFENKLITINSLKICPQVSEYIHLTATLDEVRIYNRALSADEIKKLMEVGMD